MNGADPQGAGANGCRMDVNTARVATAQDHLTHLLRFCVETRILSHDDARIAKAVEALRMDPKAVDESGENTVWTLLAHFSRLARPATASGLRLRAAIEGWSDDPVSPLEPARAAKQIRRWAGIWLVGFLVVVAVIHAYSAVLAEITKNASQEISNFGGLETQLNSWLGAPALYSGDGGSGSPGAGQFGPGALDPQRLPVPILADQISASVRALDDHAGRLNRATAGWIWNAAAVDEAEVGEWRKAELQLAAANFRKVKNRHLAPVKEARATADLIRNVIDRFVLPVLYGTLGAFASALRLLAARAENGSLRTIIRFRYRIRMLLGAVLGLTVTNLFAFSQPFTSTVQISSFGLAFIAGYQVEVFFGLLDVLISRVRGYVVREEQRHEIELDKLVRQNAGVPEGST